MARSFRLAPMLALLAVCGGCASVTAQRAVLAPQFHVAPARHAAFEATLREFDDHPEYVNEMFAQARQHPAALQSLLHVAAQHLHEPDLARQNARELVKNPPAVRQLMVQTLDAARGNEAVDAQIAAAMAERPEHAARILVNHPGALERVTEAQMPMMGRRPAARRAMVRAMRRSGGETVRALVGEQQK